MANTRSNEEERGIFRREVFEYQRRRAFGEPVDTRPLSLLWSLVPASAVAGLLLSLRLLTYEPSLAARVTAVPGGETGVVQVVNRADLLRDLRPGDELRVEIDRRTYSMQLLEKGAVSCGPSVQCLELEGRFADQGAAARIGGGATATLVLSPRSLFDGWKR